MFTTSALPSDLAPIRDVMTKIRESAVAKTRTGEIRVYVYGRGALSPTLEPTDQLTATVVGWLERQGRLYWLDCYHVDKARLTRAGERLRAKWAARYPDAATQAVNTYSTDSLRRLGLLSAAGPAPLRMCYSPTQ